MESRAYDKVLLIMGVLSSEGFPQSLRSELEDAFGPIAIETEHFPFDFTDYYDGEMGEGIERFFIAFSSLISPDSLARAKCITNKIEKKHAIEGRRHINLDPGTLSEGNIVLATTKNRSHRIAIGENLYAELTLIYQRHAFQSFEWTYADYRSERVQLNLLAMRKYYLERRKIAEI